ncbi:MAG: ATP-binding cassette domain-containing protein, partial [Chloroflexi bacterium]|nr:ATP-binding cassette domain-containing protein [Chloroflexota bacterium]
MNDGIAIRAKELRRRFGALEAVKGIDFEVARGEIFSLLGPNGAGKSTTISMLSCLLAPSGGNAWVMGHSILDEQTAVKKSIGVVPQELALYEDMSARENLNFWGQMYNLRGAELARRVDEVLALIGLEERSRERVETFS